MLLKLDSDLVIAHLNRYVTVVLFKFKVSGSAAGMCLALSQVVNQLGLS